MLRSKQGRCAVLPVSFCREPCRLMRLRSAFLHILAQRFFFVKCGYVKKQRVKKAFFKHFAPHNSHAFFICRYFDTKYTILRLRKCRIGAKTPDIFKKKVCGDFPQRLFSARNFTACRIKIVFYSLPIKTRHMTKRYAVIFRSASLAQGISPHTV